MIENAEVSEEKAESENKSWWDDAVNQVGNGLSDIGDFARQKLSQLIDTIAVFIIAYCVIPVIVIITLIWLAKFLFGIKSVKMR